MKTAWLKQPRDFGVLPLTLYPTRKREICPKPQKYFFNRQLCRKLRQGKKEKAIPHIRLLRTNMVEWLCKKYRITEDKLWNSLTQKETALCIPT